MRNRFRGRDFLTLMDFDREEIDDILNVSYDFKMKLARGEPHEYLRGKTVAVVFEKPSTRTRTSFQAAIAHLGAQSFYMRPDEMQLARGEPIKDTARVIDRYCDALVMRTFGQDRLEEFARYMKNPVINALSDLTHPCQGLADLLTIREKKGGLKGLKLAYAGDIFNVCHSLMVGGGLMGFDVYVAGPEGYGPNPKVRQFAEEAAGRGGTRIVFTRDLKEALKDADVVYANTWHSMGAAEKEKEKRVRDFGPYQINEEAVEVAASDFIFMHCLPGYRGEEMTDGIVEGPHSVVWDQAENRMHTEKALMALLIG
ncbi:MAG: ornithine carbamoyltransferase [Deltaproteobacteria bacterium]|nr:ornithine carbamoyltransferase [Deltaproteobacteria bacterium]MBW2121495.1 ornithine carbamoyltransferase [Deltaproteobacteria bacterium]